MVARVALDEQPLPAAKDVLPEFAMQAGWVLPDIDVAIQASKLGSSLAGLLTEASPP
jgi:hypothetical protein